MNPYLTVKQAAEIMGVSDNTVWNWIKAGRLKSAKLGKCRRIPQEELQKFTGFAVTETVTDTTAQGVPTFSEDTRASR